MSSLPPALNFSDVEEDICKKWQEDDTFRLQNKLSIERGDEVSDTTPFVDASFSLLAVDNFSPDHSSSVQLCLTCFLSLIP